MSEIEEWAVSFVKDCKSLKDAVREAESYIADYSDRPLTDLNRSGAEEYMQTAKRECVIDRENDGLDKFREYSYALNSLFDFAFNQVYEMSLADASCAVREKNKGNRETKEMI